MCVVAMVIPPVAAMVGNSRGRGDRWWDETSGDSTSDEWWDELDGKKPAPSDKDKKDSDAKRNNRRGRP